MSRSNQLLSRSRLFNSDLKYNFKAFFKLIYHFIYWIGSHRWFHWIKTLYVTTKTRFVWYEKWIQNTTNTHLSKVCCIRSKYRYTFFTWERYSGMASKDMHCTKLQAPYTHTHTHTLSLYLSLSHTHTVLAWAWMLDAWLQLGALW